MEHDNWWTAGRLKRALTHYRVIAEVCRSGFDTAVQGGDDNEVELHFLGRLGTAYLSLQVPAGMRAQSGGNRPAVFDLADCKADVDRALKSLPRRYALLLLAFYADGVSLGEIAWRSGRPWGTVKWWRKEAFDRALLFLGGTQPLGPSGITDKGEGRPCA